MRRIPAARPVSVAALLLAAAAVAGLAVALPVLAAFAGPPRRAPDGGGPAR